MTPKLRTLAAALALVTSATGAFAQATLTHDKALAGSITPGDTAGYPILISQPGSYKLMSNLVVPADTDGIKIMAGDVSIDLNGFQIIGPGLCNRNGQSHVVTCPMQWTHGIVSYGDPLYTVTVRNGTVQGFGHGVSLVGGHLESLIVKHNAVGAHTSVGTISKVLAMLNGRGIRMGSGRIEHNVATLNNVGIDGVFNNKTSAEHNSVVENNYGISQAAIKSNFINGNIVNTSSTVAY